MNRHSVLPVTVLALCATEFVTLGALVVPAVIGLQLRLPEVDSGLTLESRLSWITTCGAIAALLACPLFGWLSDHSARRHGHRATWILGGNLAGCGFIWAAANVDTLPLLVLSWVGVQVAYGAAFAGLFGSISDFVPTAERARIVGLFAGSGIASVAFGGTLVALLLTGHFGAALDTPRAVFVAMALVAAAVAAVAAGHLRWLSRAAGPILGEPVAEKQSVLRSVAGAGTPFWCLIVQRLFVQAAYISITVYAVLYLIRRTGEDTHDAAQLVAIATAIGGGLGMLVAAGGARFVARRMGYRAALSLGIVCLLTATVLMSLSTSRSVFVLAHVFAGSGLGLYLGLDLVVALALLPSGTAGRLLGYFQAARSIPQSLVPAIGPALLAIGSGDVVGVDRSQNYFALLACGSLSAVMALGLVTWLRVPDRASAISRTGGTISRV